MVDLEILGEAFERRVGPVVRPQVLAAPDERPQLVEHLVVRHRWNLVAVWTEPSETRVPELHAVEHSVRSDLHGAAIGTSKRAVGGLTDILPRIRQRDGP